MLSTAAWSQQSEELHGRQLIQRVLFAPLNLILEWFLLLFIKDKVLHHQKIHLGSHEAAIVIRVNLWLTLIHPGNELRKYINDVSLLLLRNLGETWQG